MYEEEKQYSSSGLACDNEVHSIARRLNQSEAWVRRMLIHRQGAADESNMTVHGLCTVAVKQVTYRFTAKRGLTEIKQPTPVIDREKPVVELEEVVTSQRHDRAPRHVAVQARWDNEAISEEGNDNVLGNNVCIQLANTENEIGIPVISATREALLYYGALLVEDGQTVSFSVDNYPIWQIEIGVNYINGFLMTAQGKGFYLERHTDKPHWHQPLYSDCAGYYLLGRKVEAANSNETDSNETYHLTGFRIPFGTAVYSGLGAIHCDAALTGEKWAMGFDSSTEFSTALVRNKEQNYVKLVGKAE